MKHEVIWPIVMIAPVRNMKKSERIIPLRRIMSSSPIQIVRHGPPIL